MANPSPKPFGKRGVTPPPVITHAPQGLGKAPAASSPLRMFALVLGAPGAVAVALFGFLHWMDQRENCNAADPNQPCASSGGGSHGGSSSSSHSSGGGYSHTSFGEFGGSGSAHGGGS